MPSWLGEHDVARHVAVALIVLAGAWAVERIVNSLIRRLYWARVLEGAAPARVGELRRSQRQQTVVSLVQGLVRYGVFAVAAVAIIGVFSKGAATALFSASVLVVAVGIGMQRVLSDMVAGALLLFEGHYSVGDYVRLQPPGVEGFVDEFGLRTTVLRTLEDDRITIVNGSITSATRMRGGFRDFRLELVVEGDAQAMRERLEDVLARAEASAQQRYLLGPRIDVLEPFEAGEGELRVELRAVVPPSLEWMVEQHLVASLREVLGEALRGEIGVYTTSDAAFQLYRTAVLVPE